MSDRISGRVKISGVSEPQAKFINGREIVWYCMECEERPFFDPLTQIALVIVHDACFRKPGDSLAAAEKAHQELVVES